MRTARQHLRPSQSLVRVPADREVLDAIVRRDFACFVERCFYTLNPGQSFQGNWHIDAIAHHLELVRQGRIKRLIINVQPRSLKSIMASVALPAFWLGHQPTLRVIVASYAADLATKHANDFRAVLGAPWYRRTFHQTRVSRLKNTEAEVVTTQQGYRLATSIDGTLTGRGGNVIILDDPLKPADALSDSKRERVNDWFFNTLISRLDDKQEGAIVLVMQRLHVDDLTGRLLRDSNEWTVLSLPTIAEEDERIAVGDDRFHIRRAGDLLHPAREPQQVIDSLRTQVGSAVFSAQYQQAPIPPGGALIKRAWVRRYDQLPSRGWPTRIVQSWDTASKVGDENDWSVCTTWLVHEKRFYLVDVLRGRWDYPMLRTRALDHANAHDAQRILVEDAGVGTALIQELRSAGLGVRGIRPEHNKQVRMSVQSAKFESGLVLFPTQASWLEQLEPDSLRLNRLGIPKTDGF